MVRLGPLLVLGFIGYIVCDNTFVPSLDSGTGSAQNSNFCSDRLPGLYNLLCGPDVIGCSADNQQYDLLCPASTWFDQMTQQCASPSNVADCNSGENTDDIYTSALPVISPGSCDGLIDGFYAATPCSASIIYCSNGSPSVFECPIGQVFVDQTGCVGKDDVDICNGGANMDFQFRAEEACSHDGLFMVEPCRSSFLTCSGGISRIMACPAPLVFDPTLMVCNWPQDVEDCVRKNHPVGPCADVKDGMYTSGNCSESFHACSGGNEIEMFCPASLVFDESRQLCDYPEVIAECEAHGSGSGDNEGSGSGDNEGSGSGDNEGSGSGDNEGSGSSGQEGEGSGSGAGSGSKMDPTLDVSDLVITPIKIIVKPSEGSGIYGSGEGSGAISEGSGFSQVIAHISNAEGSGGDSSSAEISDGTAADDQLLSSPELVPSFCSSHGDGFHALGCSAVLVSCKHGSPRRLYCPTKTVWDEKLSVCNFRKEVDACLLPTNQDLPIEEFERETFDCQKEGTFSDSSCTEQFVLCTSGTGYRMNCDMGLLYSRTHKICVPGTELIECSAENTDQ